MSNKIVYLIRGEEERFNLHRSWMRLVYRLVDENNNDVMFPYSTTKKDAFHFAKIQRYSVIDKTKKGKDKTR